MDIGCLVHETTFTLDCFFCRDVGMDLPSSCPRCNKKRGLSLTASWHSPYPSGLLPSRPFVTTSCPLHLCRAVKRRCGCSSPTTLGTGTCCLLCHWTPLVWSRQCHWNHLPLLRQHQSAVAGTSLPGMVHHPCSTMAFHCQVGLLTL